MGGWSQARYQRHTENLQLQHLKEVVERLDGVVRDEGIDRVIVAGDAGLVARLRDQLPPPLAAKIVDVLRFDRHAGEDEIVGEALQALRERDADDDRQRVADVLGAWRGAGLGVAGPDATLRALQLGQVDELLITAAPDTLKPVQTLPDDAAAAPSTAEHSTPGGGADLSRLHLSDELVTRATQTGAAVRIIEDPELLREYGGRRRRAAFPDLTSEELAMSRQNKVNPGQYTSAGRLAPDDLGREMRRQQAKVAGAPKGAAARPAWETTPPAPAAPEPRRKAAAPGRAKVAAAHAVIGVTHAAAGAAKTASRAVARTIGAPSRKTAGAAQRPATDGAKTTADTSAKAKAKRAGDGGEAARQQRTLTSGRRRGAGSDRRPGQRARHAQVAVVGHRRRDDVGGRGRARRVVRGARRVDLARRVRRLTNRQVADQLRVLALQPRQQVEQSRFALRDQIATRPRIRRAEVVVQGERVDDKRPIGHRQVILAATGRHPNPGHGDEAWPGATANQAVQRLGPGPVGAGVQVLDPVGDKRRARVPRHHQPPEQLAPGEDGHHDRIADFALLTGCRQRGHGLEIGEDLLVDVADEELVDCHTAGISKSRARDRLTVLSRRLGPRRQVATAGGRRAGTVRSPTHSG